MLDDIKFKIKGWLTKLGIIKEISEVQQHKKINVSDEHYRNVHYWDMLYRGYPFEGSYVYQYATLGKQKERRLLTLNLPKLVSQEMATIIFNNNVDITIDNDQYNDTFHQILDSNRFYDVMQTKYEKCLATGGMVIKPYVHNDKVKLSFVSALNFYPITYSNNKITEGVFTHHFVSGQDYFTHLEWHEWEGDRYRISHTLHRSKEKSKLGTRIPLRTHYPDQEEVIYLDGLDKDSAFIYIKPNTANNLDDDSPLGISIFANAIDTIETIDRMIDSLDREFRLGKKRIFVPTSALKSVPDGNGNLIRYFDTDDEAYEGINQGSEHPAKIEETRSELRVEEHMQAIETMLSILANQLGFSSGAFSFNGESVKTATEVISENSKTFKTKRSHEVILTEALKDLVGLVAYFLQAYGIESVPDYEVTVHFDDSIAEDRTAELERMERLVQNKLMPKVKAMAEIHGIPEEEAQNWLDMINGENATVDPLQVGMMGDE